MMARALEVAQAESNAEDIEDEADDLSAGCVCWF
jgi:hypothetical protein